MTDLDLLVRDIQERPPARNAAISIDGLSQPASGFPQTRKRWKKSSQPTLLPRSKPSHEVDHITAHNTVADHLQAKIHGNDPSSAERDGFSEEKRQIDLENQELIAKMAPEQILQEQAKLLAELDPSTIQRLLSRSNIQDEGALAPTNGPSTSQTVGAGDHPTSPLGLVAGLNTKPCAAPSGEHSGAMPLNSSRTVASAAASDSPPLSMSILSTHFPSAPTVDRLDIADPDFLEALRQKYFPNLVADPTKLAWMAPLPTEHSLADQESPYYPGRSSIALSALRFDFYGRLIPPRLARSIPVSRGLHHHGEAAEAAGYTVGELALLARSSVPAQRCIAFQVLGRIMFRLGNCEWGDGLEDEPAAGIWRELQSGRVLDVLSSAAATTGGHRGSTAFAIEALWLFEKGGWKAKAGI